MLKRLTQSTMIFLLAIAAPTFALAQSNYAVPRAFSLDPIVRRNFKSFYVRSYAGGPILRLYPDGFYPIGWSRDGKFAYYFEPVDEACGCYFAELVIMDLRNDKTLYHFKNDWQSWMDKNGTPKPDDIRKLWRRNEKEFVAKLREHKIIQTPRFAMLPTTFKSKGKSYTAKLARTKGFDADGNARVKKFSIDLSSPSLGKKSLASAEYKDDDLYGAPLDAALAGVFKSPYEDRAAVVMLKVQRGWEGPPHTVEFQIAGADLLKGFRKQIESAEAPTYPPEWFAPINDPNKPGWEILPQEAKPGEVILSKRNDLGVLSNFAATPFWLDGKQYASVEGFWQMMLYPEGSDDVRAKAKNVEWKYTREQVAAMTAFEAKSAGTLAEQNMKRLGIDWVTYNGKRFPYRSATKGEHYRLIVEAMRAKLEQNAQVKIILASTRDLILKPDHHGEPNPPPEWKYYDIWMQLRRELLDELK